MGKGSRITFLTSISCLGNYSMAVLVTITKLENIFKKTDLEKVIMFVTY